MPHLAVRRSPLVLLLAISCNPDDTNSPTGESSDTDPVFAIDDGAHGGNSRFFFLPPLVPLTRSSGTPDGSLHPEVTVCELSVAGACGPPIARFTTEPGETLLDQIRYDRLTGSYYVVWDTRKCLAGPCALNPNARYRLRVSVAGVELGWADLDVVGKIRELAGVDWGTDVGVVRELPLLIRFRILQGAIVAINVNETIAVNDAPTLTVTDAPPVLQPVTITVEEKLQVTDGVGLLQTVSVTVREEIAVSDQVGVLPPVEIKVSEAVSVTDKVLPPVSIHVSETIGVTDAADVTFLQTAAQ